MKFGKVPVSRKALAGLAGLAGVAGLSLYRANKRIPTIDETLSLLKENPDNIREIAKKYIDSKKGYSGKKKRAEQLLQYAIVDGDYNLVYEIKKIVKEYLSKEKYTKPYTIAEKEKDLERAKQSRADAMKIYMNKLAKNEFGNNIRNLKRDLAILRKC